MYFNLGQRPAGFSFMDSKNDFLVHAILAEIVHSAGMSSSSAEAHSFSTLCMCVCVQPSLAIFVCLGHHIFCLSLTFGTARAIPAQTHILLIRLWYDTALVGVCVYAFCARPSKLLSLLALTRFMTQN
jgi:hypothetical protein